MAQLKKKETREIPEVIMAENFLNTKTTDPASSEDIKQDKQQNEKQNQKTAPRHIIFKLQKKNVVVKVAWPSPAPVSIKPDAKIS